MPRPIKQKFLSKLPHCTYFKPAGIRLNQMEFAELSHEELEAVRLCDFLQLSQEEGAQKMGVHQSTLQRILARARKKIADALINSKAIRISGGENMPNMDGTGPQGKGPRTGRGMGKCQSNSQPKNQPGMGRGMGRGFGRGRRQD